ncbi:MAG: cell envelope integrity protein TolA [Rhodomicrobium sp.]
MIRPHHLHRNSTELAGGNYRFRRAFPFAAIHLGTAASVATHALLALYILYSRPELPGAVNLETEAISVNIETTSVLEAIESSAEQKAAAAPAGAQEAAPKAQEETKLDDQVKLSESGKQPEARSGEAAKPESEQPPEAEALVRQRLEGELQGREEALRREAAPAEKVRLDLEEQRKRRNETLNGARRDEIRKASRPAGGARGDQESKASRGRVSASTGSIQTYGAIVRARIAANKPAVKLGGRSAVITLAIAPSGSLTSASIVRSSGDTGLDQAALSAVRRSAPFPPPPAGTRPRFTIPFNFR